MRNKLIVISLLFVSSHSFSLIIDGTDNVNIYSSETTVRAYDSASVTTYSGSDVAWMYGYNNSTLNIAGGEISWIHLYDNATTNIDGGEISWLQLYGSSQSNITFMDDLGWLLVNDESVVNIYGSGFNYSGGHLSGNWLDGTSFSFWALEESDVISGNIGNVLPDNIKLHTASVPEPSGLVLIIAGISGLMLRNLTKKVG